MKTGFSIKSAEMHHFNCLRLIAFNDHFFFFFSFLSRNSDHRTWNMRKTKLDWTSSHCTMSFCILFVSCLCKLEEKLIYINFKCAWLNLPWLNICFCFTNILKLIFWPQQDLLQQYFWFKKNTMLLSKIHEQCLKKQSSHKTSQCV